MKILIAMKVVHNVLEIDNYVLLLLTYLHIKHKETLQNTVHVTCIS